MNTSTKRLLFWAPRVLTIAFAAFISLFALDVFEEGAGLGRTAQALLVHLIPTGIILLGLVLAWYREWVGAVLYTFLGVFYPIAVPNQHWLAYLFISGPLFLMGLLFLLNWRYGLR